MQQRGGKRVANRWLLLLLVVVVGAILLILRGPMTVEGQEFEQPVQSEQAHDCSGWRPTDPKCEGGDKTILAVLVAFILVGLGLGGYVYFRNRRRYHPLIRPKHFDDG